MADPQNPPIDVQKVLADEAAGTLDPRFKPIVDQYRAQGIIPPKKPISTGGIQPPPSPGWGATIGNFAKDAVTSPEGVAGLASLVPGVGTLAGGAIGAGTSIAQDLYHGETRPSQVGLHAVEHGALSMVPGGLGKMMEMGGGGMAHAAFDAATHGPVKGIIYNLAKRVFGAAVPSSETVAAAPVEKIAQYATPSMLAELKAEALRLAHSGLNFTDDPEGKFNAVDELYRRASDYVEKHGFDPDALAQKVGIKTPGQRAAEQLQFVAKAAKDRLDHYTNLAKAATATVSPFLFGTKNADGSGSIPPPPSSKP